MRHFQFIQIVEYLKQFKKIDSIYRVEYDTIKIAFDREHSIYINLQKSKSFIYRKEGDEVRSDKLNTPFDQLLSKRIAGGNITKIEVINGDKILRISVETSKSYKIQKASLQLEFTGKHTNGIILDEQNRVLQAIRHITDSISTRVVKVGRVLENPPPPNFEFKSGEKIESIEDFLLDAHQKFESAKLSERKQVEARKVEKKIEVFQKLLDSLNSSEEYQRESDKFKMWGDVLLANLHNIPKWGSKIVLNDFLGEEIEIPRLRGAKNNSHLSKMLYNSSRRFRQKAENLHIERDSLRDKVKFLEKMRDNINSSKTLGELKILTYRGEKRKREKKENEMYEVFWIEGFKVLLGKNERGNLYLLQNAKAKHLWLHLKDRPSTHTIIVTDRSNIPQNVIYESAKLCADFSVSEKGNYLVDYTARRNVKIISGSNVNYINYKTIQVDI